MPKTSTRRTGWTAPASAPDELLCVVGVTPQAYRLLPMRALHRHPGKVQRRLQLGHIGHHAKAPLGVRMVERVGRSHGGSGHTGFAPGGQLQQGLCRLGGQVVGQRQQTVFGGGLYVGQPLGGHAVAQQLIVRPVCKQRLGRRTRLVCQRKVGLHIDRHHHLLNGLAHFNQLRRACGGVRLQLAPGRPVVGFVMVIHIAKQQTGLRFMQHDADVAAGPHRPKMLVFGLLDPV